VVYRFSPPTKPKSYLNDAVRPENVAQNFTHLLLMQYVYSSPSQGGQRPKYLAGSWQHCSVTQVYIGGVLVGSIYEHTDMDMDLCSMLPHPSTPLPSPSPPHYQNYKGPGLVMASAILNTDSSAEVRSEKMHHLHAVATHWICGLK